MRSPFATLQQLVIPAGARPGTPRTTIGPVVPATLRAHYEGLGYQVLGGIVNERSAGFYYYQVSLNLPGPGGGPAWAEGIYAGSLFGVLESSITYFDTDSAVYEVHNIAVDGSLFLDGERVGVPQSWAPVWTQSTTNPSGTIDITGRYMRMDEWCLVWIRLRIDAGTTLGTGTFRFSLPFAPAEDFQTLAGYAYDNSTVAGRRPIEGVINTGTGNVSQLLIPAGGVVTEAAPFAAATNDRYVLTGWYICTPP